jgi:hypothetical protein
MEDNIDKIGKIGIEYVESLWAETPSLRRAKAYRGCENFKKTKTRDAPGITCSDAEIPYDDVCDDCKERRKAREQYKKQSKNTKRVLASLKYQVKRIKDRI